MSEARPRVLLACPISKQKDYVLEQWINHISKLSYPVDVLLIDNSYDIRYFRQLRKRFRNVAIIHHKPYGNHQLNQTVAYCRNVIVKNALLNRYDYWFSLECDVFPPLDIVEILMGHKKQAIGALYNINQFPNRLPLIHTVHRREGQLQLSDLTPLQSFNLIDGKVHQVVGCGLGCILFNMELFTSQDYKFHVDPNHYAFDDAYFFQDMFLAGLPVHLHTGIVCEHQNRPWERVNKEHSKSKPLQHASKNRKKETRRKKHS